MDQYVCNLIKVQIGVNFIGTNRIKFEFLVFEIKRIDLINVNLQEPIKKNLNLVVGSLKLIKLTAKINHF